MVLGFPRPAGTTTTTEPQERAQWPHEPGYRAETTQRLGDKLQQLAALRPSMLVIFEMMADQALAECRHEQTG